MQEADNRFAHHPELKNQILAPEKSFFRDFDGRAFYKEKPELHWVLELMHTEAQRKANRDQALAERWNDDLWVFAYGSLMWDPAIQFAEVRRAHVPGYARCFVLKDIYGARGTPEAPGLMAALDKGNGCDGLAFRIAQKDIEAETSVLWAREMIGPGYIPTFVATRIDGHEIEALTFVADHDAESMHTGIGRQEQIRFITTGQGYLGTSLEYLTNIISHFEALGVVDEDSFSLLREAELSLKQK